MPPPDDTPRRRYDLTNRQIQAAFEAQANAQLRTDEKVNRMSARVDAVYHAVFGTEGQGGLLRELREKRDQRRQDWALWLVLAGIVANIVLQIVPHH